MARPKRAVPAYRLHKPSGLARVTIDGRDIYLGPHGSRESRERYARLLAEQSIGVDPRPEVEANPVTVRTLVARFWRAIDSEGKYTKNGRPTSERDWLRYAFQPLVKLYGHSLASEFGPVKLRAVRAEMEVGKNGKPPRRSTVNGKVRRIRTLFSWGVSVELIPATVLVGLRALPALRKGDVAHLAETPKVVPPSEADVELVAEHLPRTLATMVRVQWLTGMRPSEVCSMRPGELDRSGDVWRHVPSSHKTEHHEAERIILIGPRAQALLSPFLKADPGAFLFTPAAAAEQRNASGRAASDARRAARGEGHRARPNKSRDARRRRSPRVRYSDRYSQESYRQAVRRACAQAGVSWSPYALRHAAGHRLRSEFGLDATQAALGHESVSTTEGYSAPDLAAAEEAMRRIG